MLLCQLGDHGAAFFWLLLTRSEVSSSSPFGRHLGAGLLEVQTPSSDHEVTE